MKLLGGIYRAGNDVRQARARKVSRGAQGVLRLYLRPEC